jgi:hypothetical protein
MHLVHGNAELAGSFFDQEKFSGHGTFGFTKTGYQTLLSDLGYLTLDT